MTQSEFAQGVRRNQDKLFRMAYLSLRSYADCQDAVQEALLRALAARDTLRHAQYFDTWLTRILINVITDVNRRAARKPVSELIGEIPMDFAPPDTDLRDAVRALDAGLRTPLLLRYIAGYSVNEAARIMHITPAQVRWRLERAKKQLRAQLGRKDDFI